MVTTTAVPAMVIRSDYDSGDYDNDDHDDDLFFDTDVRNKQTICLALAHDFA